MSLMIHNSEINEIYYKNQSIDVIYYKNEIIWFLKYNNIRTDIMYYKNLHLEMARRQWYSGNTIDGINEWWDRWINKKEVYACNDIWYTCYTLANKYFDKDSDKKMDVSSGNFYNIYIAPSIQNMYEYNLFTKYLDYKFPGNWNKMFLY